MNSKNSVGVIPDRWFQESQSNFAKSTIEGWFADILNTRFADIDEAKNVYVSFDQRSGRWLTQEEIFETIGRIETGV